MQNRVLMLVLLLIPLAINNADAQQAGPQRPAKQKRGGKGAKQAKKKATKKKTTKKKGSTSGSSNVLWRNVNYEQILSDAQVWRHLKLDNQQIGKMGEFVRRRKELGKNLSQLDETERAQKSALMKRNTAFLKNMLTDTQKLELIAILKGAIIKTGTTKQFQTRLGLTKEQVELLNKAKSVNGVFTCPSDDYLRLSKDQSQKLQIYFDKVPIINELRKEN